AGAVRAARSSSRATVPEARGNSPRKPSPARMSARRLSSEARWPGAVAGPGWSRANRSGRPWRPAPAADNGQRTAGPHSFLENREVVIRDLQNDARHRGSVVNVDIVVPGPVVMLPVEQFLADGGEPLLPGIAADSPHRLCGVVVAVEV